MDATRIHLLITHLPVFGLFIGALALIYGLIQKSREVKIMSLAILLISVIGGIIAFQTGHEAEETVEHMAGVTESVIEQHEESAETTVLLFYGLGILALAGLYFEVKEKALARPFLLVVIAATLITFSFVARTASLGGKIRHTEIVNNAASGQQQSQEQGKEEEHDDDDD